MMLIMALSFSVMNVFARMAGDIPAMQKTFFRNLISLLFAICLILRHKTPLQVARPARIHLLSRCVFGIISVMSNFYAVDHLLLSDASMLNKMSPFFSILFAYLLLRERVTVVQIVMAVISFGGCLLILRPSGDGLVSLAALVALLGGMCGGLAYTEVRVMGTHGLRTEMIVFYFSLFTCLVCLPWLALNYCPMTGRQLLCLLGVGVAATLGQFTITVAYTLAPASQISAYDYMQVPFSAILGYIFFQQMADGISYLGYAIICGCGVAMAIYNRRLEQNPPAPSAPPR